MRFLKRHRGGVCVRACVCVIAVHIEGLPEQSLLKVFIQENAISAVCVKVLITCRTAVPRLDWPWVSKTKLLNYYVSYVLCMTA